MAWWNKQGQKQPSAPDTSPEPQPDGKPDEKVRAISLGELPEATDERVVSLKSASVPVEPIFINQVLVVATHISVAAQINPAVAEPSTSDPWYGVPTTMDDDYPTSDASYVGGYGHHGPTVLGTVITVIVPPDLKLLNALRVGLSRDPERAIGVEATLVINAKWYREFKVRKAQPIGELLLLEFVGPYTR